MASIRQNAGDPWRKCLRPAGRSARLSQQGSILLEVVLALALFVLAATIITGGLNSSTNEVKRLKLSAHADNLAASILAEIQMGALPGEAGGPNRFDPPFDQWSWQTSLSPVNEMVGATNSIQKVEVVIRHESEPVVYRLTQFLPISPGNASTPPPSSATGGGGF